MHHDKVIINWQNINCPFLKKNKCLPQRPSKGFDDKHFFFNGLEMCGLFSRCQINLGYILSQGHLATLPHDGSR